MKKILKINDKNVLYKGERLGEESSCDNAE